MLELVLGRAKSGKTAEVYAAIRADVAAKRAGSVLLVPEQYSHEAERELLQTCGDTLSLYGEVLSFSRLAERVESELGTNGRRALDQGGRVMALMLALDAVGSRLRVYAAARRAPALQQSLLAAIDECRSCCLDVPKLEALSEGRGDMLGDKLRDLALILGAYEAVVGRSGLDPMERLALLAERLPESGYARCRFYVDGFTYFNAREKQVLAALLRCGAPLRVCLTCDGLEESHEAFEPARRSARALRAAAEELGVPCRVRVLRPAAGEGPMPALERELFSFGRARCENENGAVTLLRAADVAGECEAAAARCLELVQTTGCRWRDIAVAARSFDSYRGTLENLFAHYGVPLYCARRSNVPEKPLAALIGAAYAVVTGGWDYEDVFAYLKTGLAGLDAAEVDALENYAFLWSLHGAAWTDDRDWSSHPEGLGKPITEETAAHLARINALRRRASGPLLTLQRRAEASRTAAEQAKALAAFFAALRLPELLEKRAGELRDMGLPQAAAEYVQLWDVTVNALEQAAAVLGDMETDAETFGRLFCLVLSTYDVSTIPMSLDKVGAGDMDRMRRRSIRHLIVLGCDSASLPRVESAPGVFSDEDREALGAAGVDIPDGAQRLGVEFALLYNVLTLPRETLTMSYCALGAEGGGNAPAFVMERASAVFGAPICNVDLDRCRSFAPAPALELAAEAAHSGSALGAAARKSLESRGCAETLAALDAAAARGRGRLSPAAVRALYNDTLRLSASRIDRLSSCRFSYFLQYGLRAKPRQAAEFTPPEQGTFMHYVLENVAREIADNGGFAAAEPQEVEALCDRAVERYVHEKLNDFRERTPRFVYLFRRLTRTVRAVVTDMVAELAKSDFRPLDFELDFGDRAAFPPIGLGEGNDALLLTGVADRVDGWVHDGKLYLRVVDYKTGKKAFSLSDVWYGVGLQMLLYLFALRRCGAQRYGMEIVPAGVLYTPARNALLPVRAGETEENVAALRAKEQKRSGLLLDAPEVLAAMEHGEPRYLPVTLKNGVYAGSLATAEQLGVLARHIDETLRDMAKLLRSGCINADPWLRSRTDSACSFCDYAEACQFNEESDSPRYLPRVRPELVWERMEEKAKGGTTK